MKGVKWTKEAIDMVLEDWGINIVNIEYNGHLTKITFICSECGEKQTTTLKSRKNFNKDKITWCGKCCTHKDISWKNSFEKIKNIAEKHNLELLSSKEEYKNCYSKLKFKCACGNVFFTTVKQLHKGKTCCNECSYINKCGENNYLYDSSRGDKERDRERSCIRKWRNEVYQRDDYTCQKCGKRGGNINAHHINGYSWDRKNRLNINNGITLCEECHKEYHTTYGFVNSKAIDFLSFIKSYVNTEVIERVKKLLTP